MTHSRYVTRFMSLICGLLLLSTLTATAAPATQKKILNPLPNGDFKDIKPRGRWAQHLGQTFPSRWDGAYTKLLPDGKVQIGLGGHLYQQLNIPQNGKKYQLTIDVIASGSGRISLETRTDCGREGKWNACGPIRPGGGIVETFFTPTEKPQTFHFSKAVDPYENGYFYINNFFYPNAPVTIHKITATLTEP